MARVLVVDDSSIMRRNLSAILVNAGHAVVSEAANGDQAFREYEKFKPDLVTMDITMPGLDGIGAVKKIIAAYPNANIIMISALDQKFMVLSAIQCGAKHYIIKPFTVEKVIHVINEVMNAIGDAEMNHNATNYSPIRLNNTIENINEAMGDISIALERLDVTQKNYKNLNDLHSTKETVIPFCIENTDNILTINFNNNIGLDNFTSLELIVQGFLSVSPLRVILNFGEIKHLPNEITDKIVEIMNMVHSVEGEIKIASKSEHLISYICSRNFNANVFI